MPLTKTQLIKLIATDTGFTKKKSSEVLNVMLDTLMETLINGNSITIRAFGKFYITHQNERKARHPGTG